MKFQADLNIKSLTGKTAIDLSEILPERDSNFKILFFLLGHNIEDCTKENIIKAIPKEDNITPYPGLLRATRQDNKSNSAKLNLDDLCKSEFKENEAKLEENAEEVKFEAAEVGSEHDNLFDISNDLDVSDNLDLDLNLIGNQD